MRDIAKPALVYRVQDRDGRGPYKPGMSDRWSDPDGPDHLPVQMEFGLSWLRDIPYGWAAGCAFRSVGQASRWFSASECSRLAQMGYRFVALSGCYILRESDAQAIIVRPRALSRSAVIVPWPHLAPARPAPCIAALRARETSDAR